MKKQGVSLITGIIIVVAVLAVIAMIWVNGQLKDFNDIENMPKEKAFKIKVIRYKNELNNWMEAERLKNLSFQAVMLNATYTSGNYQNKKVQDIIASFQIEPYEQDVTKFAVKNGTLVYTGSDSDELIWAVKEGISTSSNSQVLPNDPITLPDQTK